MSLRSGNPEVQQDVYIEGAADAISTGNNDGTFDLAKGTVGQTINSVKVGVTGQTAGTTITFYDGAAATTPISGAIPLEGQPVDGFVLNTTLSSGTLGYRIAGNSESVTAYITVRYYY